MPIVIDGYLVADKRKVEVHTGHHLTVATSPEVLAIKCLDCTEVVGDLDLRPSTRLSCGCDDWQEHSEGMALQAKLRKDFGIEADECVGCFLGDDGPSMHDCKYLHQAPTDCGCGHPWLEHQTGDGPWAGFCSDPDCKCESPHFDF